MISFTQEAACWATIGWASPSHSFTGTEKGAHIIYGNMEGDSFTGASASGKRVLALITNR